MSVLGRVLVLAAVVSAVGLFAGSASAAVESERVSSSSTSADSCAGPCPTVVFALGSGAGTIKVWTEWKNGTTTPDECPVGSRGQCTFYVDEGFEAKGAYLEAIPNAGVTFKGWAGNCTPTGQFNCRFTPGEIITACAKFGSASETIGGNCPPPSVQLYKKGDGAGAVTVTGSGGGSVTCAAAGCPSKIMTNFVQGETLTFQATPAPGSSFARWDGGRCTPLSNPCQFTLQEASLVCPVFVTSGAPSDLSCPGMTVGVKPPAAPPAVPPRLGSRCTIPGSRYGETINGTGRADVLCGRGGNDRLNGRANHDLLLGGAGKDRLYGHAGNDRLRGEGGNDVLYGGPGTDILEGGAGNDVIHSRGDRTKDRVTCGRGRDTVYADRLDQVARDCEVVRRR